MELIKQVACLQNLEGRGYLFTDQYDTSKDYSSASHLVIRDGWFTLFTPAWTSPSSSVKGIFKVIHVPTAAMPLLGLQYDLNPGGLNPEWTDHCKSELEFFSKRVEPNGD